MAASAEVSWAVTTTTGRSRVSLRTASMSCSPSMPGITRSVSTMSKRRSAIRVRASSALAAPTTSCPPDSSSSRMISRIVRESSTMSMDFFMAGVGLSGDPALSRKALSPIVAMRFDRRVRRLRI